MDTTEQLRLIAVFVMMYSVLDLYQYCSNGASAK